MAGVYSTKYSFATFVTFALYLLTTIDTGDCDFGDNGLDNQTNYFVGDLEVYTPDQGVPSPDNGLYISPQRAPYSGRVRSMRSCGFLIDTDSTPIDTDQITLVFSVATYRLQGNRYRRTSANQALTFFRINVSETFGCVHKIFAAETRPNVTKGDFSGIFIHQGGCAQIFIEPLPLFACPVHVNLIDSVHNANCSRALYFNSTRSSATIPEEVALSDGHPVNIFLNVDFEIEPDPSEEIIEAPQACATVTNREDSISIVAVAIPIVLVVIITFILITITSICGIIYHHSRKPKAQNHGDLETHVATSEARATISLQYNASYFTSDSIHQDRNINLRIDNDSTTFISPSTHAPHNVVSTMSCTRHSHVVKAYDYSYYNANCEFYWDPATKEEDLKQQLMALKVEEVCKDKIELKECLGSGHFGVVYRGLLQLSGEAGAGIKEVAVKTIESGASEEDKVKFLQEAAIMGQFNNPYIVAIYGVLTSRQPYMILCELMSKGDLHRHLHTINVSGSLDKNKAGALLLSYSRQVASAMVYLSAKGFIHRDLAARNILVSSEGICKIADFGLSRDLQNEDYYVARSGLVPVRWTAPEALEYGKYSTASDVWSFGVVLYEIWSLASRPYGSLRNDEVLDMVLSGHRLPAPPGCPRTIYDQMMTYCHPESFKRPTFCELQTALNQPDYMLLAWSEEDTAMYSENARTIGATFCPGEVLFRDSQRMYQTVVVSI